MREAFITKDFRRETVAIIYQANEIIESMQEQGYTLTLRQLYYQFVAKGLMENKQENYKRLGSILDDARKAGMIDWDAIEDRGRHVRGFGPAIPLYSSPGAFIQKEAESYYFEDLWRDQDYYAEVWVEKDALLGVIERPCTRLRVPYFACRGYASSTALYGAGKRFREKAEAGKICVLFHLGDHDPSGLDMTRANRESVNDFASPSIDEIEDEFGTGEGVNREDYIPSNLVLIKRLALNTDQVRQYNPPPNPAKEADPRAKAYKRQHGATSWELDALAPPVLDAIITKAVTEVMDMVLFDEHMAEEAANRKKLLTVASKWDAVAKRFGGE